MLDNQFESETAGQNAPPQQSPIIVDAPLTKWYCDVCKCPIDDPEQGYVIWQVTDDYMPCNIRIVHHNAKCNKHKCSGSCALDECVGHDGLAHLLTWLSSGPIAKAEGRTHCNVTDFDEYVDFVRRVQTPYYEQARRYFLESDVLEYYADSNEIAPYQPDALKHIIETYGPQF